MLAQIMPVEDDAPWQPNELRNAMQSFGFDPPIWEDKPVGNAGEPAGELMLAQP